MSGQEKVSKKSINRGFSEDDTEKGTNVLGGRTKNATFWSNKKYRKEKREIWKDRIEMISVWSFADLFVKISTLFFVCFSTILFYFLYIFLQTTAQVCKKIV